MSQAAVAWVSRGLVTGVRRLYCEFLVGGGLPFFMGLSKRVCRIVSLLTQVSAVCLLVFLAAAPAFAQGGSTGRIMGAVTDQSGGVIAGAVVSATDKQAGK